MVAFVIEALFAVVFGQAALGYVGGRDEVQRAVMLMFSAMAALFALTCCAAPWARRPWQCAPSRSRRYSRSRT